MVILGKKRKEVGKRMQGEGELSFPFCVTRSYSSARMKAGAVLPKTVHSSRRWWRPHRR